MKSMVSAAVAFVVGVGLGWWLSPGSYRYFYRTTDEIMLLADTGERVGKIPSSTPIISDERLFPTADLGWWGYVPVQFDTRSVAIELGIVEGPEPNSIADFTLRADFDYLGPAPESEVE